MKRVVSATSERYVTLQRQLQELERMHSESRKTVCALFETLFHFDFLTKSKAQSGGRKSQTRTVTHSETRLRTNIPNRQAQETEWFTRSQTAGVPETEPRGPSGDQRTPS